MGLFICFSSVEASDQMNCSNGEWLHIPLPESAQLSLLPPGISKQTFGLALGGFIGASKDCSLSLEESSKTYF